MKITFEGSVWKQMVQVCVPAMKPGKRKLFGNKSTNADRSWLKYICLMCENHNFTAYGSNGFMIAVYQNRCVIEGSLHVEMFIEPKQAPSGTETVELIIDTSCDNEEIKVRFISNKNGVSEETLQILRDRYTDVNCLCGELKQIVSKDNAIAKNPVYTVSVDVDLLLNALQGLKNEYVTIQFGEPSEPFRIRSANVPAEVFVYPLRR